VRTRARCWRRRTRLALDASGLADTAALRALADMRGQPPAADRYVIKPDIPCCKPSTTRPLRRLSRAELRPLADELRAYVLDSVSKTGGHLSSNLGTVELTVALHYVFNTPV
jgi:hypothetical protein